MTRTDKKHTAISKLILTAAATGIGISAVPYAQADDNKVTTVGKLVINPITDDGNNKKNVGNWNSGTYEIEETIIGYNGGGTLITEIANGEIGLGSTDAVTGGQLYSYVPSKIEEKLEEFIQDLPNKVNDKSDVKIEYSSEDKRLTLTLSEDSKEKIKGDKGENGKSAYEIWKEQNTTLADTSETAFLKSLKGEQGEKGAQGDKGEQGEKGEKGEKGDQGIQGEKGDKGEQGERGANGENGKSAYEIWKSLDTGKRADKTERDFIDSLKAEADTAFTREVNERISSIEQKVDKLDKSMNGGIAKAGAIALLPQPTYAGHSMVSASTAHYNGEQALAIGYSSLSDNGKVILKAGASFNFSGNNTKKPLFGAAFGYQW